jgi:hypothetical protein
LLSTLKISRIKCSSHHQTQITDKTKEITVVASEQHQDHHGTELSDGNRNRNSGKK